MRASCPIDRMGKLYVSLEEKEETEPPQTSKHTAEWEQKTPKKDARSTPSTDLIPTKAPQHSGNAPSQAAETVVAPTSSKPPAAIGFETFHNHVPGAQPSEVALVQSFQSSGLLFVEEALMASALGEG